MRNDHLLPLGGVTVPPHRTKGHRDLARAIKLQGLKLELPDWAQCNCREHELAITSYRKLHYTAPGSEVRVSDQLLPWLLVCVKAAHRIRSAWQSDNVPLVVSN